MRENAEGYRSLEHVTDAFIEAWGPTIERAFAIAGVALGDIMLDTGKVQPKVSENITVEGHDEKELLFNWLEALLLKFEIDHLALVQFEVDPLSKGDGFRLRALGRGEPYLPSRHGRKVEVKGVTYHQMSIEKRPTGVLVRFLLDL